MTERRIPKCHLDFSTRFFQIAVADIRLIPHADSTFRAVTFTLEEKPQKFDGNILVPFPIESALSGVGRTVGKDKRLWYCRIIDIPAEWMGKRILLHLGAVDWFCTVFVNDNIVGNHQGGYDSFSFDITDYLELINKL
ncbi:MAG: hypothetical protein K9J16_14605 [Melioribacteraceae bacterium]|nr:hypothetical protein [Melioribacteraceae bacterium]MCF8356351.1 hypothetical protein [Melioribacteraceae bacterium]MCF8395790.1 hypothetical protein [Melioribacteraceae bacterium]MCF8420655.1 hypothetical protein [Melioribacteraceae bacterium]